MLTPEKTHENPEDPPERPLMKGDKVRPKKLRGRHYSLAAQRYADCILTVETDEITSARDGDVWVATDEEDTFNIDPVYLELVTPVKELRPYRVVDAHTHWDVADKNMETVVSYSKLHHPNALAAAEDERDRLNAEPRKEHGNDHHI